MKLALFTSTALLFAIVLAEALPQKSKRDGEPILGPATPFACKIVTAALTGICSVANYEGCEETVAYTQCICAAQKDPVKVLKCAQSELTTLLTGYCNA
ncbi:hypothetical protein BKA57DRAFT_474079 [Linnemannia elongata]|nr:hypothetical protein BKA57DRAFT_474079 [Linnemannia elongata]